MGAFFTTIFGSLFGWIGAYFTKKAAVGLAVASSFMALTMASFGAFQTLLTPVQSSLTDSFVLMAFYSVLPDNSATCLTAVFMAEVASFIYRFQMMTIKAVSSSS